MSRWDARFHLGWLLISGVLVGCGVVDPPSEPVVPTMMVVWQGDRQDGVVNQPVSIAPAVMVRGDAGRPAAGVAVVFRATSGGGLVQGDTVITDQAGVGQVGSWILGAMAGDNSMVATVSGLDSVTFTATASLSLFRIDVRLVAGNLTTTQLNLFSRAASRWGTLITGDLADAVLNNASSPCHPPLTEMIDDLLILVEVLPIDGDRGALAFGGPCILRSSNNLPSVGRIRIDQADIDRLESNGTLQSVILHEMAHALGLGTYLWPLAGLLRDASLPPFNGVDPHFTGPQALAAFDAVGGTDYASAKVPVADVGGGGSQDSHWRESVMQAELMTPVIVAGDNPLSSISLASLADLGYVTDPTGVDPYTIPVVSTTHHPSVVAERLENDVLNHPLVVLDAAGRHVGTWPVPN